MQQVLILVLGTFPAASENQHRGVQACGVGASCVFWNNGLDKEDSACRAMAVRQFVRIRTAASSSQSWTVHFNR